LLANLPPGVRPHDIDRPVTRLDDASSEELWMLASTAQQDQIRDSFTSIYAAQITMDLSDCRITAAHRTWMTYRDEQLDALASAGEIR
jgi:hypothetical protein